MEQSSPVRAPSLLWAAVVLALAAAGVSGYLLVTSLSVAQTPLGCGKGSGCEEVLTSRWSSVLGVPVSLPAALIYLVVIGTALRLIASRSDSRAGWGLLLACAGAIVAAAAWFIGVQTFAVEAFCKWCLAAHGLGLLTSGAIITTAVRFAHMKVSPVAFGVAATAALAVVQMAFPGKGPAVARLPAGEDYDSGPGPERIVAVLDGKLTAQVEEVPSIGPSDAPHVLVMLFDYCCPHCRRTHGDLMAALDQYPHQFTVLLLPTPLDAECNPGQAETEPRFEEACELARLALAVWRADRSKFAEFDAWLFEPEQPRTAADATQQAEQLVGASRLKAAIQDPWIEQRIASDVEAYIASEANQIPVLLSPGMPGVVGRTSDREELFSLLEKELGLKPAKAKADE
jgi:uncharacterized membrane protein/protein-disulfide isomerase